MNMHASTFDYLKPTEAQVELMAHARQTTKQYAEYIASILPDGPDKTYVLRRIRETAMWVNVAITREADGTPRP